MRVGAKDSDSVRVSRSGRLGIIGHHQHAVATLVILGGRRAARATATLREPAVVYNDLTLVTAGIGSRRAYDKELTLEHAEQAADELLGKWPILEYL